MGDLSTKMEEVAALNRLTSSCFYLNQCADGWMGRDDFVQNVRVGAPQPGVKGRLFVR